MKTAAFGSLVNLDVKKDSLNVDVYFDNEIVRFAGSPQPTLTQSEVEIVNLDVPQKKLKFSPKRDQSPKRE